MQQTWTVRKHDGPNHLGWLWLSVGSITQPSHSPRVVCREQGSCELKDLVSMLLGESGNATALAKSLAACRLFVIDMVRPPYSCNNPY